MTLVFNNTLSTSIQPPIYMQRYICSLLFLLLFACTDVKTFNTSAEILNLHQSVTIKWDRFCVLKPYTYNKLAEEILGLKFNVEEKSRVYYLDSISLLVFIKDNQVVEHFEVPLNNIDFTSLPNACYTRDKASFKIIQDNYERYKLQPVETLQQITK